MFRFVTLAALFVMLNPLVLSAQVEGSPDLQLVPEDNRFSPGDTGRFTFSIINNGEIDTAGPQGLESQVMMAEGLTYTVGGEGDAPVNIREDIFAVGTVPDGLFPQKPGFSVSVDENASSGMYTVPVNLSYRYKDSIDYNATTGAVLDYDYNDRFVQKNIILRVDKTAELELVDSSYSGSVGDSGTLTLRVRNVGNGSVSGSSFSLQSMNPDLSFGRSSTAERFAGEWEKGETKTFRFKASVAPNTLKSEMTVKASSSFTDGGYPGSDSFTFGVDVAGENKFSLEDVEANLRKGSTNTISGTVVNDAGRTLEGVELVFSPRDPYLTVKQSSYAVGIIEEGESAEFSFPVEVSDSAEPGPRLYSVDARYRNTDGDVKSLTSLSFDAEVIDSEGSFVVETVNSSVEAGGSSTLTLSVRNPSNDTYRNIDAKLFTSEPLSTSDDRAFVSTLGPGESETLSFSVGSSSSALEKTYPVTTDFRYEVDGESKMSDSYSLPVSVNKVESEGLPVLPIGVGVIVLLLALSYYFGRPEQIWNRVKEE